MKNKLLPPNRLAEAIGIGAATLIQFLSKYGLQSSDCQKAILECIGYLIAHLHLYASLSNDIIPQIVEDYRFPREYCELIYDSAEFYSRLNHKRLKNRDKEGFWYISVLYQNMLTPGTHKEGFIDFDRADFFKAIDFWIKFNALLATISEGFIVKPNNNY